MLHKWGCGGQEVPEGGFSGYQSVPWVPRVVPEAITVSHGSYLTTFVKGSPPRNGSNYVKTRGVLMPPKWGCGGQEVPEGGF